MNRSITTQGTHDLIRKIRQRMPQGSLRTTFIVGMPGETEDNYQELTRFVKESQFEKMGVFVYSKEEGTDAFTMPGHVAETIKKRRMNFLMKEQQKISHVAQEKFIGRTLKVLIEEQQEGSDTVFLGRSEYDAPDVDGVVYVNSPKKLKAGDFVHVKITDPYQYYF